MKNQALFSSNDENKKLECCLLQFLFGPLRVKVSKLTFSGNNSCPPSFWRSPIKEENSFLQDQNPFWQNFIKWEVTVFPFLKMAETWRYTYSTCNFSVHFQGR